MTGSSKRKPLAKAHASFYKGLKEVGRNESQINVVYGIIQISFFVGNATAAKSTLLKEKDLQERVGDTNSTLFSRYLCRV